MNDAGAILDYASPRKRSVMRLPAVSRLAVEAADGRVRVEQSLTGQGPALVALAFACAVLLVVVLSGITSAYDFRHGRLHRDWQAEVAIPAILFAAVLACMVGVVQQTWRRTALTAEFDELRLSFTSPLRRRHFRWTNAQIADVVLVLTANINTGLPLAEVLITRVAGGDVRLFTDHPASRLGGIARAVHNVLRDGRCDPLPPDQATTLTPEVSAADVAPHAERTTGRLIDSRRTRRDQCGGTPGD